MGHLIIEGLRPRYEILASAIHRANLSKEQHAEAFGALDAFIQMQLFITTTYKDMTMPQMMAEIEQDMRYIEGKMTIEEEEKHIAHHWELIEQLKKKEPTPNEQRDKAIALVNAFFDEKKTILVKDEKHGVKEFLKP